MSTVRIACIGAGYIAGKHLTNLASLEGVQIVAIADVDPKRAHEQAQCYGARPYSDWRGMLAAEQPDAVYLCIPPYAHGEPEETLLAAGIPFFVEKPLALEPEIPERLARLVQEHNLLTSVGYHWRYLDTVRYAHDLVAKHRPRLAVGYWFDLVPPPHWWTRRETSGGQMVEQTTHIFDLARYFLGEVARVFGAACPDSPIHFPEADIEAGSAATLQFQNGAIGIITSTCIVHYPHRIGLWLYAQDLIIECCEFSLRIETPAGREHHRPQVDPYRLEDEAFIYALRTGDRSGILVPYSEALRTHRVIMRVRESAEAGRPLSLIPEGTTRAAELAR